MPCCSGASTSVGRASPDDDAPLLEEVELEYFDDVADPELDEAAVDLDLGLGFEPPPEPTTDEGEIAVDFAALLIDVRDESETDDTTGPEALELTLGIDEPPPELVRDDEAANVEFELAPEDLPALDADEQGFHEELFPLPGAGRDEPLPPVVEVRWEVTPVLGVSTPCHALGVGLGVVAAGGKALYWLEGAAKQARNSCLPTGRVQGLAVVGLARELAVCANESGAIFHVAPSGEARLVHPGPAGAHLTLAQLGTEGGRELLARSASGRLYGTVDAGLSWREIPLNGTVTALSLRGGPAAALVDAPGRPELARFESPDTYRVQALPVDAVPALDREVLLATRDALVVVAHPEHGVFVSTDDGATFRRVPGTAGATAIDVGVRDGRPAAWAAVYAEADDLTHLIWIDLATDWAWCVATLDAPDSSDADADEQARVHALAWDAAAGRLWAAGPFGLVGISPPRQ